MVTKAYEMAVKAAKNELFAASIASASSHLAQLFRVIGVHRWGIKGITLPW